MDGSERCALLVFKYLNNEYYCKLDGSEIGKQDACSWLFRAMKRIPMFGPFALKTVTTEVVPSLFLNTSVMNHIFDII